MMSVPGVPVRACRLAVAGLAAALATVLPASLAASQAESASGPWAKLHRPLHLPKVAPGAPCPVSRVGRFDFARYGVPPAELLG